MTVRSQELTIPTLAKLPTCAKFEAVSFSFENSETRFSGIRLPNNQRGSLQVEQAVHSTTRICMIVFKIYIFVIIALNNGGGH